MATNKTKTLGPESCSEVPTTSGCQRTEAIPLQNLPAPRPLCLDPSPLLIATSFPANVEKTPLSSSIRDGGGGGALSMEKGPTHRLQPTGSLISFARLRSGPKERFHPTPSTWPKIFCQFSSLQLPRARLLQVSSPIWQLAESYLK